MSGYVIAQIEVTNPENYKEYLAKVTDIVKKFDGEFLVRGGEFEHVEGEWKHSRNTKRSLCEGFYFRCHCGIR